MTTTTTSSESKTYQGGCHCGDVRYQVTMKLTGGMTCNCSICSKTGTVLTFVPETEFKLISGEGSLTDYQFGKQRLHHLFCKRCGIRSFARGSGRDGTPMAAINIRCLDEIDLASIPTQQYDGKKL
jgi:hypothetical protein